MYQMMSADLISASQVYRHSLAVTAAKPCSCFCRVWEFGIPVQIKYIADPGMHSVPAVTLHPSHQYFIGQSLDNQIVTYSAKDKFRQNRKKVFKARHPPSSQHGSYLCQVRDQKIPAYKELSVRNCMLIWVSRQVQEGQK